MSTVYPVRFFVSGRDTYANITPNPATALGYFANSLIPSLDTDFPRGELRLMEPGLTAAQQAPQKGRDYALVNLEIDFTI